MKKRSTILEIGKVYEVMRNYGPCSWRLGMARADIVNGQEVLVGSYDWDTREPLTFTPLHLTGLTGKIFTDAELEGTGFGRLFGHRKSNSPSAGNGLREGVGGEG